MCQALDAVLAGVTPTLPLTIADTGALFDLVKIHAPAPLIREVKHDHKEIVILVYEGNRKIYERRLQAAPNPRR